MLPTIDINMVCLYKERWFHIWYQREKDNFWNAVARCQPGRSQISPDARAHNFYNTLYS